MKLDSIVIDVLTGERLPNATVRISNNDGSNVTGGTYANDNGEFSIDVPDSGFIIASFAGYKPAVFPVSLILQTGAAALERSEGGTLEEVVVTAKKNANGLLLVAGLLVVSYLSKKL